MKKIFEITIDTDEFGKDFEDKELEEFIADRLGLYWNTSQVEIKKEEDK